MWFFSIPFANVQLFYSRPQEATKEEEAPKATEPAKQEEKEVSNAAAPSYVPKGA